MEGGVREGTDRSRADSADTQTTTRVSHPAV